ncbi:phosphotransferase, partial [Candidatus Poribacteria bacterium]|nr:phosphotransferase [Candidatus Poribacteria bacterium]
MIPDPTQITPDWITSRLRASGSLPTGEARRVTLGEAFESTAAFWTPLEVEYDGATEGAPRRLLYKLYREAWYGGGVHETVFYSDFVAEMTDPPVGACYAFAHDDDAKACYLLLQDISATHDPPGEDLAARDFHAAACSLVKVHTHWWEHDRLGTPRFMNAHGGPLRMANACSVENVRANARHWRERALPAFLAEHADKLPSGGRDTLERAVARWPDIFIDRIADGRALTFLHGDAHVHNMFFARDSDVDQTLLVDWETYKRGIGPYDIAYMLVFFRAFELRREIEQSVLPLYYDGLVAGGVSSYSR